MGLELEYRDGQTPLEEEEKSGLRIRLITNRGELDEYEQQNIEIAIQWILGRSFKPDAVFTETFIRNIHKRMDSEVAWGRGIRNPKTIGVDFWKISIELRKLLEDARYWYENNTYPPDEMALRFKHRIVSIHCFSNGNGRHSRLMADIIIEKLYEKAVFSWGAAKLSKSSDARKEYLKAVKAADTGDYSLLLAFARS
ncbi:MAG: mobile mystery protein B [Saprospiraceae bacterium]|nr:mobile mystery protein B [Candidatus Opimibacter skivensis]